MTNEKIIGRGAEALLIQKGEELIKRRIPKSYRLPILDEKLRKQRTRKEAKLLEKAAKLIPTPTIKKSSDKTMEIDMEFIEGKKLSEHLDNLPNAEEICKIIGENIAKLHDADIIHGDLTTSNMIYVPINNNKSDININKPINKYDKSRTLDNNSPYSNIKSQTLDNNSHLADNINNKPQALDNNSHTKVYFIDFGLGYESNKIEDKAVDLHLIKQALEAKHFKHYEKLFKAVLEGYKLSKHHLATLKRLEAVEKRGRYKQAY